MKQSILITRKLPEAIIKPLTEAYEVDMWHAAEEAMPREELLARAAGKSGILCMLTDKIDREVVDRAGQQLRTVSTFSVGYDHVDTDTLKEQGITLGYTPDVLNDSVADLTIALMLSVGRRLPEAAQAVKSGAWGTWSPYWMTGQDLSGSTVGVIGMGSIAETVVRRLKGFDCNVLYHSRSAKPALEDQLGIQRRELPELLASSDFVTIHAPLTEGTREMCNDQFFAQMKRTAVFINTSRGGLVNQDDLLQALKNGTIYGAGLDVTTPEPLPTDSPLLELDNCVVLPHIASASVRTRNKMAAIAIENLIAGLQGTAFVSQVKL